MKYKLAALDFPVVVKKNKKEAKRLFTQIVSL